MFEICEDCRKSTAGRCFKHSQKGSTKKDYDKMIPRQKGYVSYMQGQWNPEIPNANPYYHDTDEGKEFATGEQQGVLEVQEGDD